MGHWRRRLNVLGLVVLAMVIIAGVAYAVQVILRSPTTVAEAPSPPPELGPPCPASTVPAVASAPSWDRAPVPTAQTRRPWALNLNTTCGQLRLELDGVRAPRAAAVMIFLAQQHFFDNSPCHRLTTTGIYVLQCGDPTGTGVGGPGFTFGPVENAPRSQRYPAGTVAMARMANKAKSMGSQFFIVYKDSTIPSDAVGAYTVVGKLTGGSLIIKDIADRGVRGGSDGPPRRAISILSTTSQPL